MNIIIQLFKALLKNKTVLLILSYLALITTIVVFYDKYRSMKEEANRLSNNQTALMTDIEFFKTESGNNAAKVIQLEMAKGEFEKLCSEQMEVINDLNLKVKRLEGVSTTVTKTEVSGTALLHDTVVYTMNDTVLVESKVKTFEWSDQWNRITGTINKDTVDCRYEGTDTLTIVCTKVPKKFLFFKWGCKRIEANIVNKNKSSNIVYNKTIKLK